MRRNLRLDWRALALLGALLSIIIEWPGLVLAMPAIDFAANASSPAASTSPAANIANLAAAAPTSFLNSTINLNLKDNCKFHTSTAPTETSREKIYNREAVGGVEATSSSQGATIKEELFLNHRNISSRAHPKSDNHIVLQNHHHHHHHHDHQKPQQQFNQVNENDSIKNKINEESRTFAIPISDSVNQNVVFNDHSEASQLEISTLVAPSQITPTEFADEVDYDQDISTLSYDDTTSDYSPNPLPTSNSEDPLTSLNDTMKDLKRELPPPNSSFNLASFFHLSSTHHIAVLSRTERSIRLDAANDMNDSSTGFIERRSSGNSSNNFISINMTKNNHNNDNNRGSSNNLRNLDSLTRFSIDNNSNIVRRSSDFNQMSGSKTKRLNNSRATHFHQNQQNHQNINNSSDTNNSNNNPNTSHNHNHNHNINRRHFRGTLERNERSTIADLADPKRKIRLYIKNRFIQILPDGTINGTHDYSSEYTILQRTAVDVGLIRLQGVATCLYICMDECGAVYGSTEYTDNCVFREKMELHNYNTYSSAYNSNARRTLYLGLDRNGEPRKVQIAANRTFGQLATYVNTLTETVQQMDVEKLIAKNFGANRIKHGIRQLCDTGKPLIELIDRKNFKTRPQCNPNQMQNKFSKNNKNQQSSSNRPINKKPKKGGSLNNNRNSNISSSNNNNNNNNHSNSNRNNSSGHLVNNVPATNDTIKSFRNNISISDTNSSSIRNSSSVRSSFSNSSSISSDSNSYLDNYQLNSNSNVSSSASSSNSTHNLSNSNISINNNIKNNTNNNSESDSDSSRSKISKLNESGSMLSISDSQKNNGHTRDSNKQFSHNHFNNNNNNNNLQIDSQNITGNGASKKNKQRRRKCRPHETEEDHLCQRGPLYKKKTCKERQQQQIANGSEPTPCPKTNKKFQNTKNSLSPNSRRNKKLAANGRHSSKNPNSNNKKGPKKKKNANKTIGANGAKRANLKRNKLNGENFIATNDSLLTNSSEIPSVRFQQPTSPSILSLIMSSSTQSSFKFDSSTTPSSSASRQPKSSKSSHPAQTSETSPPAESSQRTLTEESSSITNDRVDREQRNVRLSNSMEDFDDDPNSDETGDTEDTLDSEESYEDDISGSRDTDDIQQSLTPPLQSGADDYYDQLDL